MKQHIETLVRTALNQLHAAGQLSEIPAIVQIEASKDKLHGDFACNVAMILAKQAQKKPREIAEWIVGALPTSPYVEKIEIAGPGFINFFLTADAMTGVIQTILTEKENYGRCKIGREKRVLVEFLSANPNGPLHVGHGRGGAFGDIVSNLLEAVGFKTYKEYYVNDAGRQMDILTVSIWLRYLALCGEAIVFL